MPIKELGQKHQFSCLQQRMSYQRYVGDLIAQHTIQLENQGGVANTATRGIKLPNHVKDENCSSNADRVFSVYCTCTTQDADGNIVELGRNNNDNGDRFSENIGADLYTGKLNAGFDVFNYRNKGSGLSHSITLRYDGGGNLVDNVASNIGANWSLYTGGYIAREIKGVPDEPQPGFTSSITAVTPVSGLDSDTLMQYLTDRKDGQFDIYHFIAGGTSGRFIINKNGDYILQ